MSKYPESSLIEVLVEYVDKLVQLQNKFFGDEGVICSQLLGVACLQLFIQANFTGPQVSTTAHSLFFPNFDSSRLQADAVNLLNIEGQQAYDLMQEPLYLVFAELILKGYQIYHFNSHYLTKTSQRIAMKYWNLHPMVPE